MSSSILSNPFLPLPLLITITITSITTYNQLAVFASDNQASLENPENISKGVQTNFSPSRVSSVLRDIISGIQTPPLILDPKGGTEQSNPALINVSLHIETMRNIADEVTLDFYIIQSWYDQRLVQVLGDVLNPPIKVSGRKKPEPLWYPDTYFLLVHSLIYSAEEQSVEFLSHGQVEFIRKVRLVTPCTPNVLLFPFDIVNCTLQLSSFGNTVEDVRYRWDHYRTPNAVFVDPENNNGDYLGFETLPTQSLEFNCNYGPVNFSCLKAVVSLKRNFSAYILQIYIPATLLVVLSWITFWVNIKSTPARASLSVTTVLSILTLATQSAIQNQKHVNGKVTALDVYVWVCFGFVIFAVVEFSLSDFVASANENSQGPKVCMQRTYHDRRLIQKIFSDGEKVNRFARVLLPLMFFTFVILYWLILLLMSSLQM